MNKKLEVLSTDLLVAKSQHDKIVSAAQSSLRDTAVSIHKKKVKVIRKETLSCGFCKQKSKIKNWGFIQEHLHVPPRGYIEDERWVAKGIRTCDLICPKCSHVNHIYNHPQKEKIIDIMCNHGVSAMEVFTTLWNRYGGGDLRQVSPVP